MISACIAFLTFNVAGFNPDVTTWHEVKVPPRTQYGANAVWNYRANYSRLRWAVTRSKDQVLASKVSPNEEFHGEQPPFEPRVGRWREYYQAVMVSNGWLVGFNYGEFGAALYWFSPDGKKSKKVSDHQVVKFIHRFDGLHAVEGLGHMGLKRGSIIRLSQKGEVWQAERLVDLGDAPMGCAFADNGDVFVGLAHGLARLDIESKLTTVVKEYPWDIIWTESMALSADQQRIYLAMRQYVAEVNLKSRKVRVLVPSLIVLNRLSPDEEKSIYDQYEGIYRKRR